MIYDADDAGQSATMRSLELLVEEDMNVKVVRLEKGYDPDAYIRHSGPEEFRALILGAKDTVDYMLDTLKAKYDPADISQKARIASEILPLVAKFKNEILKSEYLKKLSRELGVSESSLTAEIKKTKKTGYTDKRENSARQEPDIRQAKSFCAESMLVKILLEENELIEHLREKILPQDFKDNRLSRIIARMFELSYEKESMEPQILLNHFSEPEVSQAICELTASEMPKITDKLKLLNDCVNKIKEKSRKSKQEDLCEQIRLAQHSKDENRIYQLLNEFQFLTKRGVNKMAKNSNIRHDLKKIIELGKQKGFLTYDELNDLLPENISSMEEIDKIFDLLGSEDIRIVSAIQGKDKEKEEPSEESREDAEEKVIAEERFIPLDDPVKMYLKQMGSIPLLTRDEEITLAKNIEATEKALCEAVYLTQFSRNETLKVINRLLEKEANLEDIIKEEIKIKKESLLKNV